MKKLVLFIVFLYMTAAHALGASVYPSPTYSAVNVQGATNTGSLGVTGNATVGGTLGVTGGGTLSGAWGLGNSTFTGTGASINWGMGAININGSSGCYQLGGSCALNTLANTSNPILSPETGNSPLSSAFYSTQPVVRGYADTIGTATYAGMNTVNLTASGSTANHWGQQENSINLLGTGPTASTFELNNQKNLIQIPSGMTFAGFGENYEAMVVNYGTITGNDVAGYTSNFVNGASSTFTSDYGYEYTLINQNSSYTSGGVPVGYLCSGTQGSPMQPGWAYCLFNNDPSMDIVNLGHYDTRNSGSPPSISCGTSPVIQSWSTDTAGEFTVGTGSPATCTISFTKVYSNNPPVVIVQPIGAASAPNLSQPTDASFVLNSPPSGAVYEYMVMGTH